MSDAADCNLSTTAVNAVVVKAQDIPERNISFECQPIIASMDGQLRGYELLFRSPHYVPSNLNGLLFEMLANSGRLIEFEKKICLIIYKKLLLVPCKNYSFFFNKKIYINLSYDSLSNKHMPIILKKIAVQLAELSATLIIEFTEHSLPSCIEKLKAHITEIKASTNNVLFAMDDYGSKFNNFILLKRLSGYIDLAKVEATVDLECIHNLMRQIKKENINSVVIERVDQKTISDSSFQGHGVFWQGFIFKRDVKYI